MRKTTRSILAAMTAAAVAAGSMSMAFASEAESTWEKKEYTGEDATLRFSWWGGDERLAATLAVIDAFEADYPNIKIEAEYGSSDGYHDKLATQLASGTAPDLIQIDPAMTAIAINPMIYPPVGPASLAGPPVKPENTGRPTSPSRR